MRSGLGARLATALLLIPVVIAATVWSNPLGILGLVTAAGALALAEYFRLPDMPAPQRAFGMALGLAAIWLYYFTGSLAGTLPFVVLVTFSVCLLRRGSDPKLALDEVSKTLLGVIYIGLLTYVALLKRDLGDRGGAWVFLLLTMVWVGDAFAYMTGRLVGRHKLYPAVSPGKSWEGAWGGLLGSVLAAVVARMWYLPELGWGDVIAISLPAGVLGQLGDLSESLVKRAYGAKDSGRLLPGHGGLFDRIDALLFVAPYVYLYARWAIR